MSEMTEQKLKNINVTIVGLMFLLRNRQTVGRMFRDQKPIRFLVCCGELCWFSLSARFGLAPGPNFALEGE
jgi:hypothetical protein